MTGTAGFQKQQAFIRFFRTFFPSILSACTALCAVLVFNLKYGHKQNDSMSLGEIPAFFEYSFFITFYIFFAAFCFFLFFLYFISFKCGNSHKYGSLQNQNTGKRKCKHNNTQALTCAVLSFIFLSLSTATAASDIGIHLCLYFAWISAVCFATSSPFNYIAGAAGSVCFVIVLTHPDIFGINMLLSPNEIAADIGTAGIGTGSFDIHTRVPLAEHQHVLYLFSVFVTLLSYALRFACDKWQENLDTVVHLHNTMSNMSLLNRKLQSAARKRGLQAAHEERLRISRDMHDSLGYVFTNIAALMDAAVSSGCKNKRQTQETCQLAREQAQHGLQEMRKTLRSIREVQDPFFQSIDTVYQLKKIFEEVTGIRVVIESGNMKKNYGKELNAVLIRTVQEAFTNAVRHGRATRIDILFWEFPDYLSMTVCDSGIGSKEIVKGIGLAGMEERLVKLNGSLQATSPDEGGFRLTVRIPTKPTGIKDDV